jgi:hypothetical protein
VFALSEKAGFSGNDRCFATGGVDAYARKSEGDAQAPKVLIMMGDDIGPFNISDFNHEIMGSRPPNIDRQTFKEFPPRQKARSFTIEDALEARSAAGTGKHTFFCKATHWGVRQQNQSPDVHDASNFPATRYD